MGNTNTKKIKIPTYEVIKPSIVKTSVVGWHYETDVVEETDCCCAVGIKIVYLNLNLFVQDEQPAWKFSVTVGGHTFACIILTAEDPELSYRKGLKWLLMTFERLGKDLSRVHEKLQIAC